MSSAAVALATSAAAHGQSTFNDIEPFGFDIQPFGSDIAAFQGDIQAFQNDIAAFQGDINAFQGDINAFQGDISAFGGDIMAFQGDINAFSSDILAFATRFNPLHGDITPFYGDISPFWGNIEPFWGDIAPFGGDISAFSGDMHPFWGDIQPFQNGDPVNGGLANYWRDIGPMWGDIYSFWSDINAFETPSQNDAAELQRQLHDLLNQSRAAWGSLVSEQTGQSFDQFARGIMNDFGINVDDPQSLIGVDGNARSAFFMTWYDSLMGLTGMDHVDHWMPMIGWNPAMSQDHRFGQDAKVGLIDAAINKSDYDIEYLQRVGGYAENGSAHGAAVASLIAARHDGQGVMGMAPFATVLAYNPFDYTGTASTTDVALGLEMLVAEGANVVNMSLGVPGSTLHQDMADIFTSDILNSIDHKLTVVTAAGNEGVAQTGTINWGSGGLDIENLLIVGSVSPTGRISSFSNTPGTACIQEGNSCEALMNRFLVAPGEALLVSDNNGGVMRASGTSFAAPLVTGTISLMHDYWPWLQADPETTTEIILTTATDLGEEGVDEVYGHGMLNTEAALSPLDFNNLFVLLDDGRRLRFSNSQRVASMAIDPGTLDLWEANEAAIYAFEFINGNARDFSIPLSTVLYGQEGLLGSYQRHVQRRFLDWSIATQGFAGDEQMVAANDFWNLSFTQLGGSLGAGMMTFNSEEHGFSIRSGWGEGLQHLSTVDSFRQREDFDPQRGGANPLIGLAQGGSFSAIAFDLGNAMSLNFGMTGTAMDHLELNPFTGQVDQENIVFGARDAVATFAELSMAATERFTVSAALSGLTEQNGLFGSQGVGALAMDGEVRSGGLTLTARYALSDRIAFAGTASGVRAEASNGNVAGLAIGEDGVQATSFQVNLEIDRVLSDRGRLTFSAMQPLHVEAGGLAFTSAQVTDRETGATGVVTDQWALGGAPRHLAAEVDYSVSLPGDRFSLSVFSRYDINDVDIQGRLNAASAGGRLGLTF